MVPAATQVQLKLFHSGYCVANGRIVDPVRGQQHCRFYATWALLDHPHEGLILFDTGYAPRFRDATARWPYRLYALMTPMFLEAHESAVERLRARGIAPTAIRKVILSHFHGDHVAGLLDFPDAQVVCSQAALEQALSLRGWAAVGKGLLPDLLPADLRQRCQVIPDAQLGQLTGSQPAYDLFGDGSVQLYALPGHGRGQIGALVQGPNSHVFLAADAAWQWVPWQAGTLPRSIVRLFFDDWKAYQQTFQDLRVFAQHHPDCRMVFTHSPELITEEAPT